MKEYSQNLILLFIFLLNVGILPAQENNSVQLPVRISIPTVSLVGFAGSKAQLTNFSGKGAEHIITPTTIDTTWLNYSSIVDGLSTNSICININSGVLPAEVVVKLNIGEDVGAGAGTMGKSAGQIALTDYPQPIVTDIGTCYTGQGTKKGHQLTYSWEWKPPYDVDHSSIDDIELSIICTFAAGK